MLPLEAVASLAAAAGMVLFGFLLGLAGFHHTGRKAGLAAAARARRKEPRA